MSGGRNMDAGRDYSVIFKSLEEAKKENGYEYTVEIINQSSAISEEVEKLKEIVADAERHSFSILTTN
jgi:hypothetical protein